MRAAQTPCPAPHRRGLLRALAGALVLCALVAGLVLRARREGPRTQGAQGTSLAAVPREQPFPLAACDGVARHVEVELRGELLLHRALLPDGALGQAALTDAVAQQLRYAFAVTQNESIEPHLVTPEGPPHTVEALAIRATEYGRDLSLDWPADPEIKAVSEPLQRALRLRTLRRSDPAFQVSYRALVTTAWCASSGSEPQALELLVPRDPYLVYWYVDKAQRVQKTYGVKRVITFPCAGEDLADYEHPEYLWYHQERA